MPKKSADTPRRTSTRIQNKGETFVKRCLDFDQEQETSGSFFSEAKKDKNVKRSLSISSDSCIDAVNATDLSNSSTNSNFQKEKSKHEEYGNTNVTKNDNGIQERYEMRDQNTQVFENDKSTDFYSKCRSSQALINNTTINSSQPKKCKLKVGKRKTCLTKIKKLKKNDQDKSCLEGKTVPGSNPTAVPCSDISENCSSNRLTDEIDNFVSLDCILNNDISSNKITFFNDSNEEKLYDQFKGHGVLKLKQNSKDPLLCAEVVKNILDDELNITNSISSWSENFKPSAFKPTLYFKDSEQKVLIDKPRQECENLFTRDSVYNVDPEAPEDRNCMELNHQSSSEQQKLVESKDNIQEIISPCKAKYEYKKDLQTSDNIITISSSECKLNEAGENNLIKTEPKSTNFNFNYDTGNLNSCSQPCLNSSTKDEECFSESNVFQGNTEVDSLKGPKPRVTRVPLLSSKLVNKRDKDKELFCRETSVKKSLGSKRNHRNIISSRSRKSKSGKSATSGIEKPEVVNTETEERIQSCNRNTHCDLNIIRHLDVSDNGSNIKCHEQLGNSHVKDKLALSAGKETDFDNVLKVTDEKSDLNQPASSENPALLAASSNHEHGDISFLESVKKDKIKQTMRKRYPRRCEHSDRNITLEDKEKHKMSHSLIHNSSFPEGREVNIPCNLPSETKEMSVIKTSQDSVLIQPRNTSDVTDSKNLNDIGEGNIDIKTRLDPLAAMENTCKQILKTKEDKFGIEVHGPAQSANHSSPAGCPSNDDNYTECLDNSFTTEKENNSRHHNFSECNNEDLREHCQTNLSSNSLLEKNTSTSKSAEESGSDCVSLGPTDIESDEDWNFNRRKTMTTSLNKDIVRGEALNSSSEESNSVDSDFFRSLKRSSKFLKKNFIKQRKSFKTSKCSTDLKKVNRNPNKRINKICKKKFQINNFINNDFSRLEIKSNDAKKPTKSKNLFIKKEENKHEPVNRISAIFSGDEKTKEINKQVTVNSIHAVKELIFSDNDKTRGNNKLEVVDSSNAIEGLIFSGDEKYDISPQFSPVEEDPSDLSSIAEPLGEMADDIDESVSNVNGAYYSESSVINETDTSNTGVSDMSKSFQEVPPSKAIEKKKKSKKSKKNGLSKHKLVKLKRKVAGKKANLSKFERAVNPNPSSLKSVRKCKKTNRSGGNKSWIVADEVEKEEPCIPAVETDIHIKEEYHNGESLGGMFANDECDFVKLVESRRPVEIDNPYDDLYSRDILKKILRPLCCEMLLKGLCERELECNKKHQIRKECFNHLQREVVLMVVSFVLNSAVKVSESFLTAIIEFFSLHKEKKKLFKLSSYLLSLEITDPTYLKTVWYNLFEALQSCGLEKWEAMKSVLEHNIVVILSMNIKDISNIISIWILQCPEIVNTWYIVEPLLTINGFVLDPKILSKLLGEVMEMENEDRKSIYKKCTQMLMSMIKNKPSISLEIGNSLLNDFLHKLSEEKLHLEETYLRDVVCRYNVTSYGNLAPDSVSGSLHSNSKLQRCQSVDQLYLKPLKSNDHLSVNDPLIYVHEEEKMEAAIKRALDTSNYSSAVSTIIKCSKKSFIKNILRNIYERIISENDPLTMTKELLSVLGENIVFEQDHKELFSSLIIALIINCAKNSKWVEADCFFSLFDNFSLPKYEFLPFYEDSITPARLAITYSEIHFYNQRYKDAIGIMINLQLLCPPDQWLVPCYSVDDFSRVNCMTKFLLHQLIFKKKAVAIATMLFKCILDSQTSFNTPIDLADYYEPLLLELVNLSEAHPESAVNLYVRVKKKESDIHIGKLLIRSLLILAKRANKVPTVKELFYKAVETQGYPFIEQGGKIIELYKSFTEEEMYVYITEWLYWFRKFLDEKGIGTASHEVCIEFKQTVEIEDDIEGALGIPKILREVDQSLHAAIKRLTIVLEKCHLVPRKIRRDRVIIDHVSLKVLLNKVVI